MLFAVTYCREEVDRMLSEVKAGVDNFNNEINQLTALAASKDEAAIRKHLHSRKQKVENDLTNLRSR